MDQYNANKTLFAHVFEKSIIAACQTTSLLVVRDLLISSVAATSIDSVPVKAEGGVKSLRAQEQEREQDQHHRRLASSSQVTISYTIVSFTASDSFTVLSSNLQKSITSGSFNTILSSYAESLGATALIGATSSQIIVANKLATDASGSTRNTIATQNLVVGLVILACCLASGLVAYFRIHSKYKQQKELAEEEGRKEAALFDTGGNGNDVMDVVDVYLSHAHGPDNANRDTHERVAAINALLLAKGLTTRFDDERNVDPRLRPRGMHRKISSGIDNAKTTIVFITEEYRKCVNGVGINGAKDIARYGKLVIAHLLTQKNTH